VTCVSKNDYGECSQRRHRSRPLKDADGATFGDSVALDVVGNDEDDKVGNGKEGHDASVFEGVEAAQERQWDDDEPVGLVRGRRRGLADLHESSNPELTVDKEGYVVGAGHKANDNARHEIADDDEVADSHTEALDGNGGVEEDRDVGISELGECGE
jgi:hypothetical protein